MGESEITLPLLTKLGIVAAIWLALPLKYALAAILGLIICYRYVVAMVFGLQVMDIMDLNTFSTSEKATVNSISMTFVSKSEKAHANEVFSRLAKVHLKMRSKIVKVFGDLYYKEIGIEDTMKACLEFLPPNTIKNKADVESFAGLQLSKAFPLDRPQWQVWVQLNYDGEKALVVFKNHHSLCDGISAMGFTMQCDDKFDPDKMIATGRIHFYQRMLFRLIAPLMMPVLFMEAFCTRVLKNPLHDGKRDLTGVKKCALSEQMTFADIKAASKSLKVTINDLMTSSLSVAVSRYFREKDPGSTHTRLNLALPANIRWSRYETFDDVKLENKFAPFPLTIPLSENAEQALVAVSKVTATLRSGFAKVYASYIVNLICGLILPKFVCTKMVDMVTLTPTLAFSNLPGPLKRISYKGNETIQSYCALVVAGRCGLSVGIISYSEKFSFTVVADTAVMEKPDRLKELLEEALKEYIELGKRKAD